MEARTAPQRYFHLLSAEDLEVLPGILGFILQRRSEIVRHWHSLYLQHFGEERSLSEREFILTFEPALQHNLSALADGDVERYASGAIRLGAVLAERGVPLEEVVVSVHLFEESARNALRQSSAMSDQAEAALSKLSHVRSILLTSAYFRSPSAASMERAAALEREAAQLPREERTWFRGLIGASAPMRELYDRIELASANRNGVLIVGEGGTGKEMVARAIHAGRTEGNRPFVVLNCAAIPKDLVDSELFGHEDAVTNSPCTNYLGALRAADGGTLFVDEVTEMAPEIQSKLIRAIQERALPDGNSNSGQPLEVRLVASSARIPEEAMADGRLRSDLYFRLRSSVMTVPPLRERTGDILLLVQHFIAKFNGKFGRSVIGVDEPAARALMEHSWPGNVRELSCAIEGAVVLAKGPLIGLEDLPETVTQQSMQQMRASQSNGADPAPVVSFAEMEREAIRRALETTGRNKLRAANLLRISRKKLYAKIKQHGL